jgi:hypothetical protein
MRAISVLVASLVVLAACSSPPKARDSDTPDHVAWVVGALKQMQTVRPGMTRANLVEVFRTEGGLFTGLRRTYAYRGCPYVKVDVEFQAVGRPPRDQEGRVTLVEAPNDVIASISKPYLEWSITD